MLRKNRVTKDADDDTELSRRVEQKLLKQRVILLFEELDEVVAADVIQNLILMDTQSQKPIKLLINSIGGCVSDGLAILDVMEAIKSPVYTFITGTAMSMAALISICGARRFITSNGVWMNHESRTEHKDYLGRLHDRLAWDLKQENDLNTIILNRTKLTSKEIEQCNSGELWFGAKETVEKGICDEILTKLYKVGK